MDLAEQIYKAYESEQETRYSKRIGASIIGAKCDRKLWLSFRWVGEPARFNGRMLRLFETGEREESRVIENLQKIGYKIISSQHEFVGPHLVAKVDGVLEKAGKEYILEIKTHNDKSFKKLESKGLKSTKPEHYAQLQLGMELSGIELGIYFAVNKNDDSLFIQIFEKDAVYGAKLRERVKRLILSDKPPARIADDCSYCDYKHLCHGVEVPKLNCRNCISAMSKADGSWYCSHRKKNLTHDEQLVGCSEHYFIPNISNIKQVNGINCIDKNGQRYINEPGGGLVKC
jgi:CRISPR/Cas system-associated exonuclease Cas4 (RecB family)